MRVVIFLLFFQVNFYAEAQVYRWVDGKGTVHYSNSMPPAGAKHTVVDIEVKAGPPSADTTECHTVRCQGERMEERLLRRQEVEARAAALRPPSPPPPRGMEFRKYISLQRGMSESELVVNAGEPDLVFRDRGVRTYTYLPTLADPFTTAVTVRNGRILEIERNRKF